MFEDNENASPVATLGNSGDSVGRNAGE